MSPPLFSDWPHPDEVTVRPGTDQVVMPSGHRGLTHFPDEPLCILQQRPLTFLMVCGDSTMLMKGTTLRSSIPVSRLLSPGPAGSVDNNYAGISAAHFDRKTNRWIGFYHAEDKEGIGTVEATGVQGFYSTICAAEFALDGQAARKLGPVITADKPKLVRGWETEGGPPAAWLAQGVGVPSVCESPDGKDLLCWYAEWSNRVKRGVQLCVSRCPVESSGLPGSWKKLYQGQFSEDGLAGHETPILSAGYRADTYDPHVRYVKEWKRFVMVFGASVHTEILAKPPKAIDSGLFVSTSQDGVTWSRPVKIETVFPLVVVTQRCKVHPMLQITSATEKVITGQLLYGYTPRWPDTPHHLGSSTIRLTLADPSEEADTGIRKRLAGTRWMNSNKVSFEWTKDGRLRHNGNKDVSWEVVDGQRIQVVFQPDHIDTLVFNESFTEFKQLIRGGPATFEGKRVDNGK